MLSGILSIKKHLAGFVALISFLGYISAFSDASAEKGRISLPVMEEVSAYSFSGDEAIYSVIVPEGVLRIEEGAFFNSGLTEITLPDSLESIGKNAFANTSLTYVHASENTEGWKWAQENLVEYRALLIGESRFLRRRQLQNDEYEYVIEPASRNSEDAFRMNNILDKLNGFCGGKFQTDVENDVSYDRIPQLIQKTFAGTTEQDVSLFFIATHGQTYGGALEMPYLGTISDSVYMDQYRDKQFLTFETLASWLNTYVQGKVIVILESCGSGAAIHESAPAANGNRLQMYQTQKSGEEDFDPAAFAMAAVKAFESEDPGISSGQNSLRKTGEFATAKFYVLASAAYQEESYGTEGPDYYGNNLTKWLVAGVGEKGASPADENEDMVFTFSELYNYISFENGMYNSSHQDKAQYVQCYPKGSGFEMFKFR